MGSSPQPSGARPRSWTSISLPLSAPSMWPPCLFRLLVLLFALAAVKKEVFADPLPAPDAEADPYHSYGYAGYGLGKRYGYYGYGKRSAEPDPHHHYYGGYRRKGYGYRYGYGKRSAEPDPNHHYYGHGGYGKKGYGRRYYGYGKRSAGQEMTGLLA